MIQSVGVTNLLAVKSKTCHWHSGFNVCIVVTLKLYLNKRSFT